MTKDVGAQIIEKAKSIGASLAGIASLDLLKQSPSYKLHERIKTGVDGIGPDQGYADHTEIKWPEDARSALVIAVSHPHEKPELDWFLESGYLPGNQLCMDINRKLSAWIEGEMGINTHHVNYWIPAGGVYLKDLAVLSGLGCIGRNNLLITPEFGPRVRLRAILLDEDLAFADPVDFDPCNGCEGFCRKVCPRDVFDEVILSEDKTGLPNLPARNGSYSRPKCLLQMNRNHEDSGISSAEGGSLEKTGVPDREMGSYRNNKHIMYCRRCELSCPVGA